MILLAIDPGYDKCGYALFNTENKECIASGIIQTAKSDSISKRLHAIYLQLEQTVKIYMVEMIGIENVFFFKNKKTVIHVSKVIGCIQLLASQHNIESALLSPLQIKQAITGYGKADKKAVQKILELELKDALKGKEDDEVDAIACGYAFCLIKNK